MPELPEVERGRRLAEDVAMGRRIDRVWCADDPIVLDAVGPRRWRRALEGKRVRAARRWGKQLWLELDAPPHPLFHFGMSGALKTPGAAPLQLKAGPREDEDQATWPPRFEKIRIRLDDGGELALTDARRLGRALLRDDPEREPPISRLGFDPLLSMPATVRFCEKLRRRRGIVKSLLLDQSFAAGVGNWIADEALYQAGIDPRRRASSLTDEEARRLRARLASIVRRAVRVNADSSRYPRAWLFHRRWGRQADARTARGEPIEHVTIGGRTTAWAPTAQHGSVGDAPTDRITHYTLSERDTAGADGRRHRERGTTRRTAGTRKGATMTTNRFAFATVMTFLLGAFALPVQAQQTEEAPFRAEDFEYGDRFRLPDGQQPEIWNPAKRKLLEGGPMVGGTVRATDPRTYCAMAAAGYDFIWVEMQHESISWEQVARFWRTCPGPAAPGARVAYADEREIQHATDMGAAVIVVPTVDTVEEAQEAVNWTYFPPVGRRSFGGGQGPGEIWNEVPGGYRQTWNDNVVLILMIETLEGVENAREIARIPGVTGLFAASGDLGNFSGFAEGEDEYEALITEVATAAKEAGIHACAPLRWADRPDFTCFQAGTEGANIRRGATAELQQARERYTSTGGGGAGQTPSEAGTVLANLTAECGSITYEADCHAAVESAATAAGSLSASDQALVSRRVRELIAANPGQAARIREIAAAGGLDVR